MTEPYTGEIRMFAGNFAPRAWALCDGQLLAVAQNDALFSLLGTTYGGDGRTTFGLPDLRGRLPVHQGSGPGLTPRAMGQKAGSEQVALVEAQIGAHTHPMKASSDLGDQADPTGNVPSNSPSIDLYRQEAPNPALNPLAVTEVGGNTGGGTDPHNNLMPFQCVYFIIALFGVYPSRS